ncbi:hypothetical protein [Rhizobium rhizogenes]|uniref:hypothetical protein n=1 Tax=Rhizobium rhizogenes TaxID=359 RepID=UPI002270738E|nr:hypothetical protein [Rhizobium rhizogenes]
MVEEAGSHVAQDDCTHGERILYVRQIALCDGAMGNFSLEYPQNDQKLYGGIVDGLVKSLAAAGPCE